MCPCGGKPIKKKYSQIGLSPPEKRKWSDSVYICEHFPKCYSFAYCFPGTSRSVGQLADKNTRKLRKRAHEVFDQLWISLEMTRNEAYLFMSKVMSLSKKKAHIAQFSKYECEKLIFEINKYNQRELALDDQWKIFFKKGVWIDGKKEPKYLVEEPKYLVEEPKYKVEEPKKSLELPQQIPVKMEYGNRLMTLEKQEGDILYYRYTKKYSSNSVDTFYMTRLNHLFDQIENRIIKVKR